MNRNAARYRHGCTGTYEHGIWLQMKQRCLDPNNAAYDRYGGRGIKVCDRWLNSFEAFLDDMGPRPTGLTIDRINNNGHYEPTNCRWTTYREQRLNSRSVRLLTFNGETRCLTDWARITGIGECTIFYRLQRGWSVERALTEPVGQ